MAAAEAEAEPKLQYAVINSYQGAFGPPTLGHYQAMKFAAKAMLRDFPDKNILMLFMPTAAGSAKPHLALTQKERIDALTVYCKKLKEEFKDAPIEFEASRIEYDIYKSTKSTATISTLTKLKNLYPNATLCLTMGLDNLFDLPYWKDSHTYKEYTTDIYISLRDFTDEEKTKLRVTDKKLDDDKTSIYFTKDKPSWSQGSIEKFITNTPTITYHSIGKPAPTSSSMLRYILRMLDTNTSGKSTEQLKSAFFNLTSIPYDSPSAEPWQKMLKDFKSESIAKDPSLLQELERGLFFGTESLASKGFNPSGAPAFLGGARSTPSNRMATAHRYESTVKGTMAWANSELEHVGRIASVKDKDLQYSYALSTVNGMAHLHDALLELARDPSYNHEYPEIARTHNEVVRVMKHLIREYKINLNTIRAFNTRKVLSDFSYLKYKGTHKSKKATKAKKSSKRRSTRRS